MAQLDYNEYNINFLGDGGVGKSALIHKLKTDEFKRHYMASFGSKVHPHHFRTNYGTIVLNLVDYAGQEKYSSRFIVLKSHATVLMFDMTNKVSYKSLSYWHEKCENEPVIIVGNKYDCASLKVTPTYHETHDLPYVAVSTKTMSHFTELMTLIIRTVTGHDDLIIMTE